MTFNALELRTATQWGGQGGLLSVSEMEALYAVVVEARPTNVLEIGHYYGLSTAVLAAAARTLPGCKVTTVDHHQGDQWVPRREESRESFLEHRGRFFPEVEYFFTDSQKVSPHGFDFLFYDGDHGQEQVRFVMEAERTKGLRAIVLDDIDFPMGKVVREQLVALGWIDKSLPTFRGPSDKADPLTMSLGVFLR